MLRRLANRIRHTRFKTKIFFVVGFVALAPTVCLFVIFWRQIASLQQQEIRSLDLAFEQQAHSINQSMDSAMSNALRISTNPEISNFFSMQTTTKEYVLDYITAFRPLLTYIQETESPELSAARFYTQNRALFSNLTVQNVYKSQNLEFFDQVAKELEGKRAAVLLMDEGRSYYSIEYVSKGALSIFCPVSAASYSRTILEYELSLKDIFQNLDLSTDSFRTTGYTLFHVSGKELFASDPAWAEYASGEILEGMMEEGSVRNLRVSYEGKELLLNGEVIPAIDCVLISHSDLSVIFQPVRDFQIFSLSVIAICILISWLLAAAMVSWLLRRTNDINGAILHIQEGNFDVSLPVEGDDFIDQVAQNLNNMAAQIKNLIQNDYENRLQIKDLQIRMLSQQISPHFLYNTLECLRMRAVLEDNAETAQALTSLGRLLRYYANYSAEFSPVRTELEEMRDYVNVIDLIEGRKCVFETEVPPELLSCPMPRFVLQPIIENSIKHGSRSYSAEIHVLLAVREERGTLSFTLTDDGVGVSPSAAAEIQEKLRTGATAEDPQSSIGLYNTNARIRLLCGEQYGVLFSSVQGLGTSVSFTIPLLSQNAGEEEG